MRMAIVAAALMLGGCNLVTSTTPMFSAEDVKGQAQLRPGVWMDEHQSCDFDVKAPVDAWPACADGWIISGGAVIGPRQKGTPRAAWVSYPMLLVAGDPPLFQIRLDTPPGTAGPYFYAGVEVLKTDEQGRITALKSWPTLCGPPPPKETNPKPNPDGSIPLAGLTKAMIPGLVVDPTKQNCLALTPGPLRVSARQSQAWGDNNRSKWVRDGDR